MRIKQITLLSVLILPLLAGGLARAVLFYELWHSPIRYYSRLIGLDMQSNLILGGWLYNGFSVFTIHKLIIAAVMFFNQGQHCPEAVIFIQMLLGVLIGPLTAWITWQLTGKRLWAGASGVVAALYAPALLHECLTLRESTQIFLAVLSLAGVLWARKTQYRNSILFLSGIALALPCMVRISSLPFLFFAVLWLAYGIAIKVKEKKLPLRRCLYKTGILAAGIMTALLPVSVFNYFRADTPLPFHLDTKYAVAVGSAQTPVTMNIATTPAKTVAPPLANEKPVVLSAKSESSSRLFKFSINFLEKLPLLFKPFEIANNVNYYFMKYKLFPLSYLPGPLLVIPLAVTGLLLIFFFWRWQRRESLLLIYILSYSIPLAFFYPLARYRLIMYPVFCILMFYPLFSAIKWTRKARSILPVLPVIILMAAVYYTTFPNDFPLRATDFIAYGKAIQFQQGRPSIDSAEYFAAAINTDQNYAPGYINLADNLLQRNQPEPARLLLEPARNRFPQDAGISYYYALALMASGNAVAAEGVLKQITPPGSMEQRCQYWFHLGEAQRRQGKINEAVDSYRRAMESANPAQQEIIRQTLVKINQNTGSR